MSERLSNLMDKHAAETDLDEFLKQCRDNPSLIARWQRYHLSSGVIRDEISESELKYDIARKVMGRLESEAVQADNPNVLPLRRASGNRAVRRSHSKAWISLALAASMILGIYLVIWQPSDVTKTASEQFADTTAPGHPLEYSNDQWQTSSAEVEEALNSLLVEHSEFTSVTGMNGLGSYSKFIAYQN